LLYTARSPHLSTHAGQVSFPGGATDLEDVTPEATALREAEEELGIHPADVRLLGRLSPMVTISYYRVTPVVGVIPFPYGFRVTLKEVGHVFTMPLRWLAEERNQRTFSLPGGLPITFYMPFSGEVLWGATARMTLEFLEALMRD
jgi:8-oxo-dGTP pyrophosphatase MutT (NUDIX family)